MNLDECSKEVQEAFNRAIAQHISIKTLSNECLELLRYNWVSDKLNQRWKEKSSVSIPFVL